MLKDYGNERYILKHRDFLVTEERALAAQGPRDEHPLLLGLGLWFVSSSVELYKCQEVEGQAWWSTGCTVEV